VCWRTTCSSRDSFFNFGCLYCSTFSGVFAHISLKRLSNQCFQFHCLLVFPPSCRNISVSSVYGDRGDSRKTRKRICHLKKKVVYSWVCEEAHNLVALSGKSSLPVYSSHACKVWKMSRLLHADVNHVWFQKSFVIVYNHRHYNLRVTIFWKATNIAVCGSIS